MTQHTDVVHSTIDLKNWESCFQEFINISAAQCYPFAQWGFTYDCLDPIAGFIYQITESNLGFGHMGPLLPSSLCYSPETHNSVLPLLLRPVRTPLYKNTWMTLKVEKKKVSHDGMSTTETSPSSKTDEGPSSSEHHWITLFKKHAEMASLTLSQSFRLKSSLSSWILKLQVWSSK